MTNGPDKPLLVVTTEPKHAFELQKLILSSGFHYSVTLALTTNEALEGMRRQRWASVVVDARQNHQTMEWLIQQLRDVDKHIPIVVLAKPTDFLILGSRPGQSGIWTIDSQQFHRDPSVLIQVVDQTVADTMNRAPRAPTPNTGSTSAPSDRSTSKRPISTLRINSDAAISHIDTTAWSESPVPDSSWLFTAPSEWFDPEDSPTIIQWIHHEAFHQSATLRLRTADATPFWVQCEWIPARNQGQDLAGQLILLPLNPRAAAAAPLPTEPSHQTTTRLHTHGLRKFSKTIVGNLANPLTAVMGHAELLLLETSMDSEHVSQVQTIIKEARAAAEILSRLGRLANPPALENDLLGLTGLLHKTVDQLAADPSSRQVVFRLDLPSDLPLMLFDYQQLQSAFSHLITSAIKSIEGPRKVVSVRARAINSSLIVEITDNGPPIDTTDPLRCVDPFAGLGPSRQQVDKLTLTLAHAVILEHGGQLSLDNLPDDAGMVCTVELPQNNPDHGPSPFKPAPVPVVVVVEESEQMIRLIKRSLRVLSIHTVVMANAHAALDRLVAGEIMAVMCSLDMAGPDLGARLATAEHQSPGILRRFITLSPGQPADTWMMFAVEHAMPNLVKPFSLSEVRNHIERILQTKAPSAVSTQAEPSQRRRTKLSIVPDPES